MSLTEEQLTFLQKHGIRESFLFDAKGLSRSEYSPRMKDEGKKIAYNVSLCSNGHSLRTRHGHCIQCKPANLAFIFRDNGTFYVAGSREGKIFKVGFTKSKNLREESLNKKNEGYGDYYDWEILLFFESVYAAEIEQIAHSLLREHQLIKTYSHEGHDQETKELFKCSYKRIKEAAIYGLLEKQEDMSIVMEKRHRLNRYSF